MQDCCEISTAHLRKAPAPCQRHRVQEVLVWISLDTNFFWFVRSTPDPATTGYSFDA